MNSPHNDLLRSAHALCEAGNWDQAENLLSFANYFVHCEEVTRSLAAIRAEIDRLRAQEVNEKVNVKREERLDNFGHDDPVNGISEATRGNKEGAIEDSLSNVNDINGIDTNDNSNTVDDHKKAGTKTSKEVENLAPVNNIGAHNDDNLDVVVQNKEEDATNQINSEESSGVQNINSIDVNKSSNTEHEKTANKDFQPGISSKIAENLTPQHDIQVQDNDEEKTIEEVKQNTEEEVDTNETNCEESSDVQHMNAIDANTCSNTEHKDTDNKDFQKPETTTKIIENLVPENNVGVNNDDKTETLKQNKEEDIVTNDTISEESGKVQNINEETANNDFQKPETSKNLALPKNFGAHNHDKTEAAEKKEEVLASTTKIKDEELSDVKGVNNIDTNKCSNLEYESKDHKNYENAGISLTKAEQFCPRHSLAVKDVNKEVAVEKKEQDAATVETIDELIDLKTVKVNDTNDCLNSRQEAQAILDFQKPGPSSGGRQSDIFKSYLVESYIRLARIAIADDDLSKALENLLKAQTLDPEVDIADMLRTVETGLKIKREVSVTLEIAKQCIVGREFESAENYILEAINAHSDIDVSELWNTVQVALAIKSIVNAFKHCTIQTKNNCSIKTEIVLKLIHDQMLESKVNIEDFLVPIRAALEFINTEHTFKDKTNTTNAATENSATAYHVNGDLHKEDSLLVGDLVNPQILLQKLMLQNVPENVKSFLFNVQTNERENRKISTKEESEFEISQILNQSNQVTEEHIAKDQVTNTEEDIGKDEATGTEEYIAKYQGTDAEEHIGKDEETSTEEYKANHQGTDSEEHIGKDEATGTEEYIGKYQGTDSEEHIGKDEATDTEEHIAKDQVTITEEDIGKDEATGTEEYIGKDEATDIDDHIAKHQKIGTDEHINKDKATDIDDHIAKHQEIGTDEHINKDKATDIDDHIAKHQEIGTDEHIHKDKATDIDDHIAIHDVTDTGEIATENPKETIVFTEATQEKLNDSDQYLETLSDEVSGLNAEVSKITLRPKRKSVSPRKKNVVNIPERARTEKSLHCPLDAYINSGFAPDVSSNAASSQALLVANSPWESPSHAWISSRQAPIFPDNIPAAFEYLQKGRAALHFNRELAEKYARLAEELMPLSVSVRGLLIDIEACKWFQENRRFK